MGKNSFVLYESQFDNLSELTMEERGQLLTAIIEHLKGGKVEKLSPIVKVMSDYINQQIDRDREKYKEKCEKNAQNGAYGVFGGRPKKEKPLPSEELTKFLEEHPTIKNDYDSSSESIDFTCLSDKINESEFLKSVPSLKWFCKHYDNVLSGQYKTFKKVSKGFENQRSYTNEELKQLESGFDSIEI